MNPTKKRTTKKQTSVRAFLGGIDVIKLSEVLEEISSPSYLLYVKLRDQFLEHDEQAVSFAKLLDAIDDGPAIVEGAMSQAGFVVGFECCRQLLLGELDASLKGGAK
jgi:hypothetical protein